MLITKRWSLYTNEESIVGVLKALTQEKTFFLFSDDIKVGMCTWIKEEEVWYVYFDATPRRFERIIQALTELGTFERHANLNGLYFTMKGSQK